MDGSGSIQQRCFVPAQNSLSTAVQGCTAVEDGSNGRPIPVLLRYLNYTPDAVILLFYNKLREILDKISRRRKATA